MSQLTIYKASAGSGKTYKLTEEYLHLLFRNPLNYRRILAVTFTNKATAEMKGRILKELYNLAKGINSGYVSSLKKTFKLSESEISIKAQQILSSILHDFSKFSVSTIDTFFQKVIRSFIREVGIQPGYTVELQQGEILSKVVDELMVEIDSNAQLREWLIEFASSNIEEGSKWDFKSDILKLAQEIFKEEYKAFDKELIEKMSDKTFLKNYLDELHQIKTSFENTLQALGKEGLRIIKNNGLTIEDFSYGKTGVPAYFVKISEKTSFEPGIRAVNGTESIDPWIKKGSPKKQQIENALHNGLFEQLINAVTYYNENCKNYYTAKSIIKYFYTLGILIDIAVKLRSYCEEQGIFLLSDSSKLLKLIIDENETPFIYEKTGNIYKYFMIDEFQDTSHIQWHNFKPLIENSLSEGNSNLLVGDVKQSIYRWRNSDWKILAEDVANDLSHFTINSNSLKTNWRSHKNIIDYNNAIFFIGSHILQQKFNEFEQDSPGEDKKIVNAYIDIVQESPENKNNIGGFVQHSFIPKNDETEHWKEDVKKRIPKILEDLQDKGYHLNDIAVLVRKGSEGQEIADTLIEYKKSLAENSPYRFDFISNDSLYLSNSSVVPLIIAALNFLLKENDDINTTFLIWAYQNIILKNQNKTEAHELFKKYTPNENSTRIQKFLPTAFVESIELLKQLPLFELTEQIIKLLDLQNLTHDIPYLLAFQDLVLNFSKSKSSDIHSFIEWWNEKGNQQTLKTPESQDAIRIITIHKSKGLEFKAVIVPFCNWEIDHKSQPATILWCEPKTEPFNRLKLIPVKYEKELTKTIFAPDYFNEKMHAYVDNLNLLYVAFTRAEQALFTFSPVNQKTESLKTVGDLLQSVYTNTTNFTENIENELIDLKNHYESSKNEFILGELNYYGTKTQENKKEITINTYQTFDIANKIRIKLHDNSFFTGKENAAFARVNHGKLMHELFENINSIEDIPVLIERMVFEGKLTNSEKENFNSRINDLLSNDKVKDWFSSDWKVKTEAEIILKNGRTIRPDRVLIGKDKIVVIDFKFGEQEEKKHDEQVKKYMQVIEEIENKPAEGYLWYVDLNMVHQVN